MTDRTRGFKDSLLADRLIRVFGGGGALLFFALVITSVSRVGMAIFNGEGFLWHLAILALISAVAAVILATLYLKHDRRSQQR